MPCNIDVFLNKWLWLLPLLAPPLLAPGHARRCSNAYTTVSAWVKPQRLFLSLKFTSITPLFFPSIPTSPSLCLYLLGPWLVVGQISKLSPISVRQRPYHVERTASRPISEGSRKRILRTPSILRTTIRLERKTTKNSKC